MSAARIQPRQRGAIHAIRKKIGLDEASYRGLLAGYGAASSSDLDEAGADAVIQRLRALEGSAAEVSGAASAKTAGAVGPYGRKVRAMWISLYNLGEVEDRRDGALHAFMQRQCGIEHLRFLRAFDDVRPVIEALKAWLIRAGVRWGDASDVPAMKRAILRAQWQRLIDLGAVRSSGAVEFEAGLAAYVSNKVFGLPRRIGSIDGGLLTNAQLDEAARHLGAWVRRARSESEARR